MTAESLPSRTRTMLASQASRCTEAAAIGREN
jgi:hypothetical protein